MTPTELIEFVKSQFVVLLHDDPETLRKLMQQALWTYQRKVGVIRSVSTPDDDLTISSVDIPDDYLSFTSCADREANFHEVSVAGGKIAVQTRTDSVPPYIIRYWKRLDNADIALTQTAWTEAEAYVAGDSAVKTTDGSKFICISDHTAALPEPTADVHDDTLWKPYQDLPKEAVFPLDRLLYSMIEIPNNDRLRTVGLATNRQTELPGEEEVRNRLQAVEDMMEDSEAIVMPVMVRSH